MTLESRRFDHSLRPEGKAAPRGARGVQRLRTPLPRSLSVARTATAVVAASNPAELSPVFNLTATRCGIWPLVPFALILADSYVARETGIRL